MFRLCDFFSTIGYHLSNVAWFISIVSSCGQATTIYTPCNYPIPGTKSFYDRCSSYLGLDYLCDIDGVMSKTDADQIHLTLNKYDCYKNTDIIRVGIATIQNVHMPASIVKSRKQNVNYINQDWNCSTTNSSKQLLDILQYRNSTGAVRYLQWFANVLGSRWFKNECSSYILFFSVTRYVIDSDNRKLLESPYVYVSLGDQLKTELGEIYNEKLQRDLIVWHKDGSSPIVVMKKVLEHVAQKRNEINDMKYPKNYDIPFWAIYAFMTCFAVLAIALLLDCLIVRQKALSLRSGGSSGNNGGSAKPKSESTQVHLYF